MSNPITQKIMVIRHAEKPTDTQQGVTADGVDDPESLIVKGWQRAGALAVLFDPFAGPLQNAGLVRPEVLIASDPGNTSKSKRPLQTITPLSQRIKIDVNVGFGKDDYKQMADMAMSQTGTVLIAWQHQDIPHIANHILAKNVSPQTWPGDRFDVVWVFDWDASTKQYLFSQVPQNLLSGDINAGIAVTAS